MAKMNSNVYAIVAGVAMIMFADVAGTYATAVLVGGAVLAVLSGKELLMGK